MPLKSFLAVLLLCTMAFADKCSKVSASLFGRKDACGQPATHFSDSRSARCSKASHQHADITYAECPCGHHFQTDSTCQRKHRETCVHYNGGNAIRRRRLIDRLVRETI